MKLADLKIVVSGAAGGMGRHFAVRLAEAGAQVAAGDVNEGGLAETAGMVTDCLSGDVNKDFSRLYAAVSEFAEVPEPLPYGMPLTRKPAELATV